MNARSLLPGLKTWFGDYVRRFSSDDLIVQANMDLKIEHTRRVCEAILDVGGRLDLSEEELCLAEASALLHDIGRFEQYRRYRTFADYRSEDHAALGVKVLQAEGALEGVEPATADTILRLVGYHNRAALPSGEEDRFLFFLRLLRDADKIDIWRVVTDYYRNAGNIRNHSIELDLPDTDRVSDPVFEALMQKKIVQMSDLRTLQDFKLLQIGWIYDVHFPRTFQIVRDRRYLETIREALPRKSPRIEAVYERARAYLERHASAG
ncbi:MAG: HD domain-containing protein [Deltaproteobacteria bacterium]|nr:HD domain-containing protein [Deltaproteobacteria bacterium]